MLKAPSSFVGGDITFDQFAVGQFAGYNRTLFKLRRESCPVGHRHSCSNCSLGVEQCPVQRPLQRACRANEIEEKECAVCGREAWHDGDDCLECLLRASKRVTQYEGSAETFVGSPGKGR